MLTRRLPAGMNALMIRRFVLTSKTLNTSMRGMVAHDPLVKDVMTLLRKTMGDPWPGRTEDWHNKELKLPQECVCLVKFLLRWFRRSRRPSPVSIMPDPFAICAFPGCLKIVSKPMMQLVSCQWKKMWKKYCDHKNLATVLISERPGGRRLLDAPFRLVRCASVPLITDGFYICGPSRRRSRSVPSEDD